MSYAANRYNYGTPLSGAAGFTREALSVADAKYFTLSDNILDGTYTPVTGDVGLWDSLASGADGTLESPFVVTITETVTVNAIRLLSSTYCYPVDFTIALYNGSSLLHTVVESGNTSHAYLKALPSSYDITSYVVSIAKVSAPNAPARLFNAYTPWFVHGEDTGSISATEITAMTGTIALVASDSLSLSTADAAYVPEIRSYISDIATVGLSDENAALTNVHTRMKGTTRRVYGKVAITYTDPLLDNELNITSSGTAYNSSVEQVVDGDSVVSSDIFTLYQNDLSGKYAVGTADSQVGWVSSQLSGDDGYFAAPNPYLTLSFAARPIINMPIIFDTSRGAVLENFIVEYVKEDGTSVTNAIEGNTLSTVILDEPVPNVTAINIVAMKMSKPGYPVVILDIPIVSTVIYKGYADSSDLISIDTLEELTYDDEIEALGGMSANEVTVILDNSKQDFYFNNAASTVAGSLKRNRKIVPWLGVEVVPGEIEWYQQGVFWSYSWKVPIGSLTATVVGFDTIGLLDTTSFINHQTLINVSLGESIEYILSDAKKQLSFISYNIDPALYDIVVPYVWFPATSHAAALRKVSQAYPMHIYCDRDGTICAAPQKLHLDFFYDTWSDDTNVISKEYSSLHTTLPNIVNVTVINPRVVNDDNLATDNLAFDVSQIPTRTLNFSKPYVSDLEIIVDKDNSVSYTYEVFSWGVTFTFTGYGTVRSINCKGLVVDTSSTSTLTRRDENSIRLNGAITRDVSSDFIQTSTIGAMIMNRLFSLSELDKYDVTVKYRGDISLSINDPIILKDGIAPTDKYNIRRHQLTWNGGLIGSADLNT